MQEFLPDLKQVYCSVFRENSVYLRQRFFSDTLVRQLWIKFMQRQSSVVNNYFKELKGSLIGGRKSLEVLISDIV